MDDKEKQTRTIRIFLSYASEQKPLVSQVADLLKNQFDLWFDRDSLTGGDSLFREISDGLEWCDYGVAFLSKEYLAKGWTNAEFGGLWTKQLQKRSKVILPVWYDVTFQEVYNFSPMVADLTAFPSQDANQIGDWIRRAVGVAEQSRKVYDPLKKAILALQQDIAAARLWPSWSSKTEGVQAVLDEWGQIATLAEDALQRSDNSTFSVKQDQSYWPQVISIEGPPFDVDGKETIDEKRIIYALFNMKAASNTVYNGECTRRIVLRFADQFQSQKFEEAAECFSFQPYCTSDGKPIWRDSKGHFFETQRLVEDALRVLTEITHKAVRREIITRLSL
jgi:hypothetical protein